MSVFNVAPTDPVEFIEPGADALLKYIQRKGRTPPVSLEIYPLENLGAPPTKIDRFLSYNFKSSVIVPVESFSCEVYYNFQLKQKEGVRKPSEGDIFVLRANQIPVGTGIVDQLDMETDSRSGTKLTINGRNLLGQWQDQDSVSVDSKILWGRHYSVDQIVTRLAQNTRINPKTLVKVDAPTLGYLAATQPGESKLSSMQRYCESLDIYFWMSGDGKLTVGRPDMFGKRGGNKGTWFCSSIDRKSNCTTIRSTRASTQIPNIILPIWNGQENVQSLNLPQKALFNDNDGPRRLLSLEHRTPKAVVVSTPDGSQPQDLSEVNTLLVAQQNATQLNKAGASSLLQAYAKREMARANMNELKVQVNIVGHYNPDATPVLVDSVHHITYDDDDIDEDMYLYEIEYFMDVNSGPQSKLYYCPQKSLVSDVRAI